MSIRYRRAIRIDFVKKVSYSLDGQTFESQTRNISLSGVLLDDFEARPTGREIQLRLPFHSTWLQIQGKVYRSGTEGLGITFLGLDSETHQALTQLIQEQLHAGSSLEPSNTELWLSWLLLAVLTGLLTYVIWKVSYG